VITKPLGFRDLLAKLLVVLDDGDGTYRVPASSANAAAIYIFAIFASADLPA
jgi:hypothetical protein